MILLVCGGRDYRNDLRVWAVLDAIRAELGIDRLVHGACGWDAGKPETLDIEPLLKGADRHAHRWAVRREIAVRTYPANWTRYGRPAGMIRNAEMHADARPDLVVAFPGGSGTEGMARIAERAGTPLRCIDWTPQSTQVDAGRRGRQSIRGRATRCR